MKRSVETQNRIDHNMLRINWFVSAQDHNKIMQLAEWAHDLATKNRIMYMLREALMDITCVHANGCPLDLDAMLRAIGDSEQETDLIHDLLGIRRHLDRTTGQLLDCFVPRFALPEVLFALEALGTRCGKEHGLHREDREQELQREEIAQR